LARAQSTAVAVAHAAVGGRLRAARATAVAASNRVCLLDRAHAHAGGARHSDPLAAALGSSRGAARPGLRARRLFHATDRTVLGPTGNPTGNPTGSPSGTHRRAE